MRTTLTLDDDVAAQLEAFRAREHLTLKHALNSVLRRGLLELSQPRVRKPFRTKPLDMGRCRVPNLDNIAEVLAELDNESTRR